MEFAGNDRYRIVRRLGAGGMGVVYEADDLELGQQVALKTIKNPDHEALYRFKREFRELVEISHPNLVPLHELVVTEDACFFTMDLIRGTDLLTFVRGGLREELSIDISIDDTQPFGEPDKSLATADTVSMPAKLACNERRLRAVLPQLCAGLIALHEAGKIHRDVKPTNILVTSEGRPVLLDFGLVAGVGVESVAGGIFGTVDYMAPEQARGETKLTAAVDWYALGVMLYEALTGRLPFEGEPIRVLVAKQEGVPAPPRTLSSLVPRDLDELCVELLSRRPEARPTGKAVLRRLGVSVEIPPANLSLGKTSPGAPFAGRESEIGKLDRCLSVVREGKAATVALFGTSGIGKSTLVRRFLEAARAGDPETVVLEGRCRERETVAYKAIDGLVDELSRFWLQLPEAVAEAIAPRDPAQLARIFPVLGRVPTVARAPQRRQGLDPQHQRTRGFAALRELLQRLSDRCTVILFLDDLQWVDVDTMILLTDLMRAPDPPRVLLVLASREEGRAAVEDLMKRLDMVSEIIDVEPLGEAEAAELTSLLLGEGASVIAPRIAAEASGNPFFLGELCRYVQTVERASLDSIRLDRLVLDRVARLSESARRLLHVAVVAGEPLSRRAAALAARLTTQDLVREINVLRAAHLLRTSGMRMDDRIEPYHDRIRETILGSLPDRRRHHEALAIALEGEASADALARHWRGAGNRQRAAEYARRAADEAIVTFDFDRGAGLYRMALELGTHDDAQRQELRTKLGEALANAGRPREAAQEFQAAATGSVDRLAALELSRRSAEELLRGGYIDEGLRAIQYVLDQIGLELASSPFVALLSFLLRRLWLRLRGLRWRWRRVSSIPPQALANVDICYSVAACLGVVDTIRGADFQSRHLLLALRVGEPKRVARALAFETIYLATAAKTRRSHRVAELAQAIADKLQDQYLQALASWARGCVTFFVENQWRESLRLLNEAERLFRSHQMAGWETDTIQLFSCFDRMHLGELADLAERVPSYCLEAERRGDRYFSVNLRTRINIVWLMRDDAASAERDLKEAIGSWAPLERGFLVQHFYALHGGCELALYRGDVPRADEEMARSLSALRSSLLLRVAVVEAEVLHLRARIALARAPADASRIAEAKSLARTLSRSSQPVAHGWAALVLAGIAALEGDDARAATHLRAGIERLEQTETMLYVCAAKRRLGAILGGDRGAALRGEAEAWMTGQGVRNPGCMEAMLLPGFQAST